MKKIEVFIHNRFTPYILFGVFSLVVFYIYFDRAGAFNFIDEYNNYLAGFFLLHGKKMYSEIFFQHQPFAAYISFLIQKFLKPNTLYKLVLYHRLAVVLFAFCMDALLVRRFRYVGLGFTVLFELTKFYVFGSTFLAESFVVYPLVYMLGIVWKLLNKRAIPQFDFWIITLFAWFIIVMREPYIPVALVLYGTIIFFQPKISKKIISILLLLVFTALSLGTLPLKQYLFEVVTFNFQAVVSGEVKTNGLTGFGILKVFLYPLTIFINGKWNYFREILVGIDISFFVGIGYCVFKKKQILNAFIIIVLLGLAILRPVVPGTTFFEAYHMMPWYGMFIMITMLLCASIQISNKQLNRQYLFFIPLIAVLLFAVSPQSFIWEKVNRQNEFFVNYGQFLINGEVIQNSAQPNSTLFVDGWESLLFWSSNIPSSYPYLFYYPPMQGFSQYVTAKNRMYTTNPPDFVFAVCDKKNQGGLGSFPKTVASQYILFSNQYQSQCLFIKKSVTTHLTSQQLEKDRSLGYSLSPIGK